jgi:hypothetical protein
MNRTEYDEAIAHALEERADELGRDGGIAQADLLLAAVAGDEELKAADREDLRARLGELRAEYVERAEAAAAAEAEAHKPPPDTKPVDDLEELIADRERNRGDA